MKSVRSDLAERKSESEVLLNLTAQLSDHGNSVVRTAILKSAEIILLYNCIESTTEAVLERVHEVLSKESYIDLRIELRKIWASFYFSSKSEKTKFGDLEGTILGDPKFPTLENYLAHVGLFSGNLDGRALQSLLGKYGIGALKTANRGKLLIIKNKRNKIAHGEEMFKESCRNFTLNDMRELHLACFDALESVVEQADDYIRNGKFRFVK